MLLVPPPPLIFIKLSSVNSPSESLNLAISSNMRSFVCPLTAVLILLLPGSLDIISFGAQLFGDSEEYAPLQTYARRPARSSLDMLGEHENWGLNDMLFVHNMRSDANIYVRKCATAARNFTDLALCYGHMSYA